LDERCDPARRMQRLLAGPVRADERADGTANGTAHGLVAPPAIVEQQYGSTQQPVAAGGFLHGGILLHERGKGIQARDQHRLVVGRERTRQLRQHVGGGLH